MLQSKIKKTSNKKLRSIKKENEKLIQEINQRADNNKKSRGHKKDKLITYLMIFIFPPYGLYRLWFKGDYFHQNEIIVWSITAIVYVFMLFKTLGMRG